MKQEDGEATCKKSKMTHFRCILLSPHLSLRSNSSGWLWHLVWLFSPLTQRHICSILSSLSSLSLLFLDTSCPSRSVLIIHTLTLVLCVTCYSVKRERAVRKVGWSFYHRELRHSLHFPNFTGKRAPFTQRTVKVDDSSHMCDAVKDECRLFLCILFCSFMCVWWLWMQL